MRHTAGTTVPCVENIPVPRKLTGTEATIVVITLVLASALAANGMPIVVALQLLTGAGLAAGLAVRIPAAVIPTR
ncbi:hypothetical protein QF026_006824 [Streptomyces aurantiacus]|uniref:hypothetical protein n=1 Tax=Streptomyces aurantiacus TaxID=47760 RepID=UPI00278E652C|nr:hypothetical protein [Streptomyces aurantiacus]MDQ0778358.1 hypothetical protein [Streptomyces aurantiacus]